jgi:hypothetical protein
MISLDNAGQFIQILIGIVTLVGGITRGIPEIRKTFKEWKVGENAKIDEKTQEKKAFTVDSSAKYLDLAVVLICSAYFSLVLIDALVISGRNPDVFFSLTATLIISISITVTLAFLWYRKRAELGIGWGAIITLALLIIAPGGPFFREGEKGGISGVSLWLPVPILSLLAVVMWIYEYGHPLDRAISRSQRLKVAMTLGVVILIGVVSLGKQTQLSIENDSRTPVIASNKAKELLDSVNKWSPEQKSAFYAATSDTYLVGTYFENYQAVQVKSTDISEQFYREQLIKNSIAAFFIKNFSSPGRDWDKAASDLVDILENDGDPQAIYNYLVNDLELSGEPFNLTEKTLQQYSSEIYQKQFAVSLRLLRINQLFDFFDNLSTGQQKLYLANRLKWVHTTGGKGENLITMDLPGIEPEMRFTNISSSMIDHALSFQSSKIGALCQEFDYPSYISDKYCPNSLSISSGLPPNPFLSQNSNGTRNIASIFPALESSLFTDRLQEQLSLPTNYEAYLAFREYTKLARNIILENEKSRKNIERIFNELDGLSPQEQVTFIYYFVNYRASENSNTKLMTGNDIYNTILLLGRKNIIFLNDEQEVLDDGDIRTLVTMIEQGDVIDQTSPLAKIALGISKIESQDEKASIKDLLNIQDPRYPIRYLLSDKVFRLVLDLYRLTTNEQRVEIFKAISNPISIVMPTLFEPQIILAKDFPSGSTPSDIDLFFGNLKQSYIKFSEVDRSQQKNILHRLAISLYDAQGMYSHNVLGLMIAQANSWSKMAGLIVASFLSLPIILLIIILASHASKQIAARDRLYQLLFDESTQPDNWQFTVGTPDIIHGRDNVIKQLRNLASRGWGSIAIVGRRGVGKTRILLEMIRQGNETDLPKEITAWISTPSQFEESELIESVLERLTANVENAISRHLGAKPLEIRRFESNNTLIGTIVYCFLWVVLGITFVYMSDRVRSDQIISTWFPIFLVSILSAAALVAHLFNIQPVDLTSWLERDRSSSPHTVLLYRDAKRVLRFLENRKKSDSREPGEISFTKRFLYWFGILFSSFMLITALIGTFQSQQFLSGPFLTAALSLLILSALISGQLSRRRVIQGYSLLSLIAEYRGFVDRAVFRIRHGALGVRKSEDFEVIVCIDELDKIMVPSELLAYLRRMKVIFEIPGSYYFLSISEDALHALYLGAAEGKNEIDSTFDHIIRIPPADCDLGEDIAHNYLNKHSNKPRDERIDRTIATVSYGIPRDIIRRCDEVLANDNIQNIKASSISDAFRKMQANIAYGERLLTRQQLRDFSGEVDHAVEAISSFLNKNSLDGMKSVSVILSLWVLSLISIITRLKDDDWLAYSELARDIGYRILEEQPEILIEELNELQSKVIFERTN